MIVSKKADWIFANTYVKKNLLIAKARTNYVHALIIACFGVVRTTQLFFLQKKNKLHSMKIPNHIVIESAAPHMHKNYFRCFNPHKKDAWYLKIECFNKSQYTNIAKISLFDLYKELYSIFKEILPMIGGLKEILSRDDALKYVMITLPVFSYFVCLFKVLKKSNSGVKVYSGGAPVVSSAAILAEIETYYLAHGLINKPPIRECLNPEPKDYFLVYPDFKCIYVYSLEEKEYLQRFGVVSKINLYQDLDLYQHQKLTNLEQKVIICLNNRDEEMCLEMLKNLIVVFQANSYEVIIKTHPFYKGNYRSIFAKNNSIRFIDCPNLTAEVLMREQKPQFVCSWTSTTLCEALNLGIAPICLSDKNELLFDEILYPIKEKSIMWIRDRAIMERFFRTKDRNIYDLTKNLNQEGLY